MHEDVFRAEDGYGSATQEPLPLPLDFEAHYVMNQEAWHSYALYRLGLNDVAERAVHRAFRVRHATGGQRTPAARTPTIQKRTGRRADGRRGRGGGVPGSVRPPRPLCVRASAGAHLPPRCPRTANRRRWPGWWR